MVSIFDLWLPIILSGVFVFIVSSIIHMFLGYHASDYGKLPKEDEVMDALRRFDIPPGDYCMPCSGSSKDMSSPEFVEKMKKGPVAFMTFMPSGELTMSSSLIMWFFYTIVVSIFAAYIGSRALGANANYLDVFRFVGTSAFMCYAMSLIQNSIWFKRKWSATFKSMFDGLIYGLVTAGTFGWLWPSM